MVEAVITKARWMCDGYGYSCYWLLLCRRRPHSQLLRLLRDQVSFTVFHSGSWTRVIRGGDSLGLTWLYSLAVRRLRFRLWDIFIYSSVPLCRWGAPGSLDTRSVIGMTMTQTVYSRTHLYQPPSYFSAAYMGDKTKTKLEINCTRFAASMF